jgi:hypothetical protein
MFEKFAKIRRGVQRPNGLRSAAVGFSPIYTNDNRPGFGRPQAQRPREALVCRWSLTSDGGRLECRWEFAAIADEPPGNQGELPYLSAPRLVPGGGQVAALEQIAV